MKKIFRIAVMLMAVVTLFTTAVSASSAYATYTYSSSGFVLESPDAYSVDMIVDGEYMGIDLARPMDMVADAQGNIYLADADMNVIYILDSYYKHKATISNFVNEQGVPDGFSGPEGVFVNDKYVYVCDTGHNRIVMFNKADNTFAKTVAAPVSNLFEADDIYMPVALAVDTYGRMFIVSKTTTQGIIVMSDDGSFYGFIGAQKVTVDAMDMLWRMFRSSSEQAAEDQNVSKEYNNITIDDQNFVYATTSTIDEAVQQANISSKDGAYAPVKKFNASGTDVLRRNGFFAPSGEVNVKSDANAEYSGASTIVDAAVGPEGTWSIVDQKRSKIFTYDSEGNLLFAFGDKGALEGNMNSIASILYQGENKEKLLVLDKGNINLTIFRRTDYGDILINALADQNARLYDKAKQNWEDILKRNNNFDVAYIGIGKALLRDKDYNGAMEYFKASSEKSGYASAYKEIRKEWASDYFVLIPIIVVVVMIGLSMLLSYAGKVNKRAVLKVGTKSIGEELFYGFHLLVHPFDGFWDLKHEKRGSVRSGFIILIITIFAFFYESIGTGYLFASGDTGNYGSLYSSILSIGVPLILWVVANWCLTTLFDGEGKFGDIFTASCYALFPLPLFVVPSVIMSNFLIPDESGIISMIATIGYVWCGLLLVIGMMSTHGYSVGKNLLVCIGTILGMACIMFLAILFSTLLIKIVGLISNIWIEVGYRV